ncbi:Pr6Pr family membrane protein [Pseudobutyrivibrio sp.]|uniref:Pr6Pr family membrane protein n=1 Tax=Pseudobutyrivibrio sp. TaxID=2014367 RepID=UPI0025FA79BD|nr:Pr6Pr family membrane protein [Pseudobutyrivibrio sp.]MBR5650097.1 Pr6Pr family membrane protein [Pseudobutyrivibrio sp.]
MSNISVLQKKISYLLKIIVFVSAVVGTILSYLGSQDSFMGGSRVFMFFTTQSNIVMAIISLIGLCYMIRVREAGQVWQVVKFVGTVAITLTGVVFCFVLAPTLGDDAWNIQNVLTHVVVPVFSVIDFFVVSTAFDIKKKSVFYVIIPPILYAIYAGIGYANNWQFVEGYNYPYFFLNWGSKAGAFGFTNELPFMGTAWWILALFIFLIIVGYIYLVIADLLRNREK